MGIRVEKRMMIASGKEVKIDKKSGVRLAVDYKKGRHVQRNLNEN
jgi:hypothetical protein